MTNKRLVGKKLTAREFRIKVQSLLKQMDDLEHCLGKYDERTLNQIFGDRRTLTTASLNKFDSELKRLWVRLGGVSSALGNRDLVNGIKLLRDIVNIEHESRFLDKEA